MNPSLDLFLQTHLRELEQSQSLRKLRCALAVPSRPGPLHDFGSNDYLGWSRHETLIQTAQRVTELLGTGAGASRLVGAGTTPPILELESKLAQWKQSPAALVFGNGYAAAIGTVPALVGPNDHVIVDKLTHACLIDGARLSGATLRVYPHNNVDRLESILKQIRAKAPASTRILIITESIFSMDGDVAQLTDLVELKNRFDAWLLVDEAHSTGLHGPHGAGQISAIGLANQVEITMGTFSKALGSVGGYISGSQSLIDFLVNKARSFVYSTALPPGAIAASLVAVSLCQTEIGQAARAALEQNIRLFLSKMGPLETQSRSAIQPIICGTNAAALSASAALSQAGFYVPAIRYPTVPRNQARLRVTLSAVQKPDLVSSLAEEIRKIVHI